MATDRLRFRKLYDESYVLVLRNGHPAEASGLDLEMFCKLDHAIMSHYGTNFHGATDTALEQLGRRRRVVASVPNFTILLALICSTDIVALLPQKLVEYEPGVSLYEPPFSVPGFSTILVWSDRLHYDPG